MNIDILLAMIPASLIGYSLMTCTTDIDNGIIEGLTMLIMFLATNRIISRSNFKGLLVLLGPVIN